MIRPLVRRADWLEQRCRLPLENQQPNLRAVAVGQHRPMDRGNTFERFSTAFLVPIACSSTGAIDGFLSPVSSGSVHAHSDMHETDINNNGQITTHAAMACTPSARLQVRAAYPFNAEEDPRHAGMVLFRPVSTEPGFASLQKLR